MKNSISFFGLALLCFTFPAPRLEAQLAPRLEQVNSKYEEERSKGISLLNQRYLQIYEKELTNATQAGDLELANRIKGRIDQLKKENAALERTIELARVQLNPGDHPLVGNTVRFAHNRNTDFTARIVFLEKNSANWIGLGNLKVPNYRWSEGEKPLEYTVFSKNSPNTPTWKIQVNADKKSGTVIHVASGYQTEINIRPSRSDEKSVD